MNMKIGNINIENSKYPTNTSRVYDDRKFSFKEVLEIDQSVPVHLRIYRY